MYFASWSWHAARSFVMMDTFLFCDCPPRQGESYNTGTRRCALTEWPLLIAISFRLLNTNGTVSGFGLKSVFWLFLEFCGGGVNGCVRGARGLLCFWGAALFGRRTQS